MKKPPKRVYLFDAGNHWDFSLTKAEATAATYWRGDDQAQAAPVLYVRVDAKKARKR